MFDPVITITGGAVVTLAGKTVSKINFGSLVVFNGTLICEQVLAIKSLVTL
jgi:hypothetical protein